MDRRVGLMVVALVVVLAVGSAESKTIHAKMGGFLIRRRRPVRMMRRRMRRPGLLANTSIFAFTTSSYRKRICIG